MKDKVDFADLLHVSPKEKNKMASKVNQDMFEQINSEKRYFTI